MKTLLIGLIALPLFAADTKVGKPLTLKTPVTVDALLAKPDDYVGKTVQVKGKIAEVCQAMGCWMNLSGEDGKTVNVAATPHGEVELPKDGSGRIAIVEGKLTKTEMTREQAIEQAKHEAAESGKKFDPESVKSGKVHYSIQGTGAVILGN
jgi:hypothetical protein